MLSEPDHERILPDRASPMSWILVALICILGLLTIPSGVTVAQSSLLPMEPTSKAVLGTLDKITGKFSLRTINVGQKHRFGSLLILVDACYRSNPQSPFEATSYITIVDTVIPADQISFRGWMFASSPGISGLRHPLLDVWIVDCAPS